MVPKRFVPVVVLVSTTNQKGWRQRKESNIRRKINTDYVEHVPRYEHLARCFCVKIYYPESGLSNRLVLVLGGCR